MKIETAVNLNGDFLSGHIINGKLTFTSLLSHEAGIEMDKMKLNSFILELQQVYSTMVQNEKLTSKPEPRTSPVSITSLNSPKQAESFSTLTHPIGR